MTAIELTNGVSWHLDCLALSMSAIEGFHPPADSFQMRMHYSLYVTNLMSAIDMVKETYGTAFENELEESLKTSSLPGSEVHGYIRELRNAVVHRGLDPTSSGTVVDGITCAMSPDPVWNRNRSRSYTAPARLLRDVFIHCEIAAKPVMACFLDKDIQELVSADPQAMLHNSLTSIEGVQHMPAWAKAMAHEHLKPEMLVTAQTQQLNNLRTLLKPCPGQRIV